MPSAVNGDGAILRNLDRLFGHILRLQLSVATSVPVSVASSDAASVVSSSDAASVAASDTASLAFSVVASVADVSEELSAAFTSMFSV